MKQKIGLIILGMLLLVQLSDAVITKSTAEIDAWANILVNTVREGATVDISDCYRASLHINVALLGASSPYQGTKVMIQVSSSISGDEDWTTYETYFGPLGRADSVSLSGVEAIGSTVLEVASTGARFDDDGARWIFVGDNSITNSEVLLLISHVNNTSVTVLDSTAKAHDSNDNLYDMLKTYTVEIPMMFNRVRIVYDNTISTGGANDNPVATMARISKITGM
jgi:hypothetical protein